MVTNPTHLAVAIGYEQDIDAAPYILAMGKDFLADQIDQASGAIQCSNRAQYLLSPKLWDEGEVYEFVPEETYEAIAEILRWLSILQDKMHKKM